MIPLILTKQAGKYDPEYICGEIYEEANEFLPESMYTFKVKLFIGEWKYRSITFETGR